MTKEVEGDVKVWHYRSKHIENGEESHEKMSTKFNSEKVI